MGKRNHFHKMGPSSVPMKDRLLMKQFNDIAAHRNHAALTAMKIAILLP